MPPSSGGIDRGTDCSSVPFLALTWWLRATTDHSANCLLGGPCSSGGVICGGGEPSGAERRHHCKPRAQHSRLQSGKRSILAFGSGSNDVRLVGGDVVTVNYFYSGGSAGCFVEVEKSAGSVHQQHTTSIYKRIGEPAPAACRADGVSTDDGQPKQAKSRNNPNGRDGPQKSCEVQDCADGQGGDTERISKPVLKNFGWRHSHWLHHCESPGSEGSDGEDIEDV